MKKKKDKVTIAILGPSKVDKMTIIKEFLNVQPINQFGGFRDFENYTIKVNDKEITYTLHLPLNNDEEYANDLKDSAKNIDGAIFVLDLDKEKPIDYAINSVGKFKTDEENKLLQKLDISIICINSDKKENYAKIEEVEKIAKKGKLKCYITSIETIKEDIKKMMEVIIEGVYETKEKIEEYEKNEKNEKNEKFGGQKDVSNGDGCCHVGCIIH